MKKRILAALLVGSMCTSLLAGCGSASDSTEAAESDQVVEDVVMDYEPVLPTGAEEAEIYVEKIDGLSDDFIKGVDVSTVLVEEKSGVVYYNKEGQEEDLFKILADAGVNYIRVRVWNDPYDKNGMGYGGGNNDVPTAAEIGKRAAMYGMKLCVDFHYSDFWADPAKQFAPKEWAHYTIEDKMAAAYEFTKTSLQTIADAGADIGMVQIGNEINNGVAGETETERMMGILSNGSKGVRDFAAENEKDIKIAVHYTNIEDPVRTLNYAKTLEENGVDYDVFGVSYYAFWHGTMENLTEVLKQVSAEYGKETAVLETSYAYTLEDGDCNGNSVGESDLIDGYAATVQSQATCIRDIMAATNEGGGLGVFYWEPAWIPVGTDAASNAKIWEEYGSGWASSYAAKYDPNDAGKYYGGCAWDNQAVFDFTGHPLASLDVFKYVNYGTICEPAIDYLEDTIVKINISEPVVMPETVQAVFNDRAKNGGVPVTWNEEQVAAIDNSVDGVYTIDGTLEDGTAVTATVEIANVNWVENPSFEEKNVTMWEVTYEGDKNPTDVQTKAADAVSGENSFHFWSDSSEQIFTVSQTISGLAAGNYTVSANIQGGDVGSNAEFYLYAIVDGQEYRSDNVTLEGWAVWQTPQITDIPIAEGQEITIGMSAKAPAKGWGTIDDFYLFKQLQ